MMFAAPNLGVFLAHPGQCWLRACNVLGAMVMMLQIQDLLLSTARLSSKNDHRRAWACLPDDF
jgi:hypothetical protein